MRKKIDIAIITIRQDEQSAILSKMPQAKYVDEYPPYAWAEIENQDGSTISVALFKCPNQGIGTAGALASAVINKLNPYWLGVAGIAGGAPDDEFTLGDVVIADKVYDYSTGAQKESSLREVSDHGGPMHPEIRKLLLKLPFLLPKMKGWEQPEQIDADRPSVDIDNVVYYGSQKVEVLNRKNLLRHFGPNARREPRAVVGPIVSSPDLVKDTKTYEQWRTSARDFRAVEMELGGIYQAAQISKEERPILAIRGISDIIGVDRDPNWTAYACKVAASFFFALLRNLPSGTFPRKKSAMGAMLAQNYPVTSQATVAEPVIQAASIPAAISKVAAAAAPAPLPHTEQPHSKSEGWHEGSCLLNGEGPELRMNQASEEFIRLIQEERQRGYGFVPFVGAGFSSPSGAPLVWELEYYLRRCIGLSLTSKNENPADLWRPRTDQWPPFIDREERDDRLDKIESAIRRSSDDLGRQQALVEGKRAFPIWDKGQRSAPNPGWREALTFLSRLDHGPRAGKSKGFVVKYDENDGRPEVIDACFRQMLKEKSPALVHKMLGVLAGALRLDLILTTNLDDLIERAFAASRNPLEVIEVPRGVSLPHWSAVSGVRSLLKLGNRHSLLDRPDSKEDKEKFKKDKKTFLEYLLSPEGRKQLAANPEARNLDFQNYLLVMGVSPRDHRTLELIEYAWERLRPEFGVFWLCYADDRVDDIRKFTSKVFSSRNETDWKGSIILQHTDFGLLLLQMYQTIRRNLPPYGAFFPSIPRLTLPPLPSALASFKPAPQMHKSSTESFCKKLLELLQRFQNSPKGEKKLVVATSSNHVRGMTSACSRVFHDMETDNVCLWLDMNDISSTDDLFEVLLEAAYYRLGQEHWIPYFREVDKETGRRSNEIDFLAKSVSRPWIIFLNARETPGANTEDLDPNRPHGWLDQLESELKEDLTDRSRCTEQFLNLLKQLCGPESQYISVVLMCRNQTAKGETPVLLQQLGNKEEWLKGCVEIVDDMLEADPDFSEETIVADAIQWTSEDSDQRPYRQRFLHALVLMQRPRLLATIWSDAASLDEPKAAIIANPEVKQQWLNELEGRKLLRRKAGGFIWLHSRCRQLIRQVLDYPSLSRSAADLAYLSVKGIKEIIEQWEPKLQEPEIHAELAAWYGKVLEASEAPTAIFEAVYHLCRSVEADLAGKYLTGKDLEQCLDRICERLNAGSALLKANSFLVQTHGYARGSCRRLEHIRSTLTREILEAFEESIRNTHYELLWETVKSASGSERMGKNDQTPRQLVEFKTAIRLLRLTCTEVMRAIAREVGEDAKAYLRHVQFGELLSGKEQEDLTRSLWPKPAYKASVSQMVFDGLFPTEEDLRKTSARAQWVRWWRWSGMLGIASRSYKKARTALDWASACVANPRAGADARRKKEGSTIRSTEYSHTDRPANTVQPQELSLEELRVIELSVELSLLQYSLKNRLSDMKQEHGYTREQALMELGRIEKEIQRGRALAARIRSRDHSADSRSTVTANWCECRLLIHRSICTSRRLKLVSPEEAKAMNNVMGLLGDAEAILRISDPRRYNEELAMVELHRAEARIQAAEAVRITKDLSFSAMCRKYEDMPPGPDMPSEIRAELLGTEDAFRRVRSLVTDAQRFLDRAEPVLRERRRNVWWITWFIERKLRSIAMSVWASVLEHGTPIPFLGLEAANALAQTLADRLREDAIRMISVDAYRLVTITHAYASCAKALQVRLLLDEESVSLASRKTNMRANLQEALSKLNEAKERRNQPDSRADLSVNDQMDPAIQEYMDEVRKRADHIQFHLEYRY